MIQAGIGGFTGVEVILNNSSIKNVYNAGELKGTTDLNGIIKFRNEKCKIDFENAYYIDNTTKGSNLFNDKCRLFKFRRNIKYFK